MKTVLITGVAGFVGPYAAAEFAKTGARVVGFDRNESAVCHTYCGDIRDTLVVERAFQDAQPDVVLHLAGFSSVAESWKRPEETFAINVEGTRNILEAARSLSKPSRILVVSSGELYLETFDRGAVETDPIGGDSPYAKSRVEQERLVQEATDLEIVVARAFNHTGPTQPPPFVIPYFASEIVKIERGEHEPILRVGNLAPERDFSDVRDVVRAYRLLLENGKSHEMYNVCSSIPRKISDVLEMMLGLSTTTITVESDPALFRPVDCPIRFGDPSKIQNETGWRPVIPFEQTVADVLAYWRNTK
ncbi:MAG: GDP-mannose 4,6-dehydratase [Candidatus Kerfeldbacteria bacterium]|nr:GDP-mannose 4,6-dehydratase [Candidatus Kerfeldbacteria bacterium]